MVAIQVQETRDSGRVDFQPLALPKEAEAYRCFVDPYLQENKNENAENENENIKNNKKIREMDI